MKQKHQKLKNNISSKESSALAGSNIIFSSYEHIILVTGLSAPLEEVPQGRHFLFFGHFLQNFTFLHFCYIIITMEMLDLICGVSNYVGKAAENTLADLNDLDILTEKAINNLNNNINLKSKEEEMYLRVLLDAINDLIENH